ncbi:hypothetical protein Nepgr_015663 [Nepenthes gracilis]|uniref:RING-type E3 ubiquitin transferase n=1 Tax=Nepenthes gracilis TaxID=150966 RepID=A0AAD3SMH8_NEPGR|nr:hypothetical protein Nepgr_015663 [Nepenthes gracilis]
MLINPYSRLLVLPSSGRTLSDTGISCDDGCLMKLFWRSTIIESRLVDYRISASGTGTSVGIVCQEGRNLSRWSVGEPSSGIPQNHINNDERMMQNGWPSSVIGSTSASPRLETQRYEPANSVSRSYSNLMLHGNQTVNGPSFSPCSNSGSTLQNYDLNVGLFGRVDGNLMECSTSPKFGGLENKLIPSASCSSDPFASSSSSDFLVEENGSGPGGLMDSRRLSCKRKALEGNAGQCSSSGICFMRTENSPWPAIPAYNDVGSSVNVSPPESSLGYSSLEQVDPRLGLGTEEVPSNSRAPNVARNAESLQRNYCIRMDNPSNQQHSMPNISFSLNHRNSDAPSIHQPLRRASVTPPLELMSPPALDNSALQSQSVVLRVPSLQHHMQALRWNGASSSRPGGSSAASVSGDGDPLLSEDLSSRTVPRNISEHPMFAPRTVMRNSDQNPTNWSVGGGNATMSSNVASSSGSLSGPNSVSHHRTQSHSRRLSEYVRRSLLSSVESEIAARGSNILANTSIPSSAQEVGVLPGSGIRGHNQSYGRSAFLMERQGDGAFRIPNSWRNLAAAGEGRNRLVSEIRNVLDIMRRGDGLRFEDVMILDPTVLFGIADIHDQHRNMRLDVDNMSYEELLALEERIGNVCTGLSEETVLSRMKQLKYISPTRDAQTELEPCCICREEYIDGEDIGTLDCGHDFHTDCIKQWLAQKNLCPICKTTALAMA